MADGSQVLKKKFTCA